MVAADSELALGPPLGERWDGREPRCLHLRGLRPVTPPGTLPLRGPAVRGPPDSPARGPLRPLGTALSGGVGYAPRWPEGSIWRVSCVARGVPTTSPAQEGRRPTLRPGSCRRLSSAVVSSSGHTSCACARPHPTSGPRSPGTGPWTRGPATVSSDVFRWSRSGPGPRRPARRLTPALSPGLGDGARCWKRRGAGPRRDVRLVASRGHPGVGPLETLTRNSARNRQDSLRLAARPPFRSYGGE